MPRWLIGEGEPVCSQPDAGGLLVTSPPGLFFFVGVLFYHIFLLISLKSLTSSPTYGYLSPSKKGDEKETHQEILTTIL